MASGRSTSFTLEFKGELTIRSIGDVRTRMIDALREHPQVTATIADDAIVDLTFVQLIESARRTALDGGRTFALATPAAGALRETLERGGFLAGGDAVRREFWLMESGEL